MSRELETARELVRTLEEKEKDHKVELSKLISGDVFKIGIHDFIVLEHGIDVTAVISKNLMTENEEFGNSRNYKDSNIRRIIEEDILPEIESEIGSENIIEHEVDLASVDMQNEFGTYKCKMRPITFDEARLYNNLIANKELPDWYWTCTPWSTEDRGWNYSIAVVSPSGDIFDFSFDCHGGVRPVCILKSNIFVSKVEGQIMLKMLAKIKKGIK